MKKVLFALGLFAAPFFAPSVTQANLSPVASYCIPINTIHNGDSLDAIPVMANFNYEAGCALNAGDLFYDGAFYTATFSHSSASLAFTIPANVFVVKGARVFSAANSQTAIANSTNYYWIDTDGVVRSTLSNSAPTANSILLYTVVTNTSGITGVTTNVALTSPTFVNGITASQYNALPGTSPTFNTVASQAFNIVGSAANATATFSDNGSFALSNGAFHGDASGNLAANSIGLAVPLAIGSGGTGTNAPSLVGGTGIAVSGAWPNQTIAFTGGTGLVSSAANNVFTGTNAFNNVTTFNNQAVLSPAGTATSGTNYNSQQLSFQNSTYSAGSAHTNTANIYLGTNNEFTIDTGIIVNPTAQSQVGGTYMFNSASGTLPGPDVRTDGANLFINPISSGNINLGYDTSALNAIKFGPAAGWGIWQSNGLTINTPASVNGMNFVKASSQGTTFPDIRTDGNNVFLNPNGSSGIGLGNDDSSLTGITFGPLGAWGTWNGTSLAMNNSASIYNTLTVGHVGTSIRAWSASCGTANWYSDSGAQAAGVNAGGLGLACGDGGTTMLALDSSGNLGINASANVNGSITAGASGSGEINQTEHGFSVHQYIDNGDNLGWYDATHNHTSGAGVNLNSGVMTATGLNISGTSNLTGVNASGLNATGNINAGGNIAFGGVTTGGTLNGSTGNVSISGLFHAGSNGTQTVSGAFQWGVDHGGFSYATLASNDGSCPGGVCANVMGIFRSDGANVLSLDDAGNFNVTGVAHTAGLQASGDISTNGNLTSLGALSIAGNTDITGITTMHGNAQVVGSLVVQNGISSANGINDSSSTGITAKQYTELMNSQVYTQIVPLIAKGSAVNNQNLAHMETLVVGNGITNFKFQFDAAPTCTATVLNTSAPTVPPYFSSINQYGINLQNSPNSTTQVICIGS
jgi:hypothetical protein